mmetsp:Transcript_1308/g.2251  ORF Transcript_1308/g.2251 Transcript_1308/m.2251 type:complete len:223 (+) Transcript_1308:1253-1921(+)
MGRASDVFVQLELLGPPLPHFLLGEVEVAAVARPAPAVEVRVAVSVLNVQGLRSRLLVDVVVVVSFDVRVDDGHHSPTLFPKSLLHLDGVGEESLVPREVPLSIRVFDIQPEDVIGVVVLLELFMHSIDVLLVLVVPATLVVAEGEERGESLGASEGGVLLVDFGNLGATDEQEDLHDSGLRHPVAPHSLAFPNVDEHLAGVVEERAGDPSGIDGVRDQERN